MTSIGIDFVARDDDGATIVARDLAHEETAATAEVRRGNATWSVEVQIDPRHHPERHQILCSVISATIEMVREHGGGPVHWWARDASPIDRSIAADLGLTGERELYQLRRPLPLEPETVTTARPIATRPFVVGTDEQAWLYVNNRAFADHPEQGGWALEELWEREAESWFDPDGFLLHEVDGRLAAFCWTKVHAGHEPALGEIYVIGVDPDFHGHGLGRAMTIAGLEALAARGVRVGMLYVESANAPALGLYYALGFTLHHVERAFVLDGSAR
ncbi:MAG: mycothiol synthase [Actinobacteria bacterium]|nr:MAG: mycothiol synthase [Actinomycetota bacterium]